MFLARKLAALSGAAIGGKAAGKAGRGAGLGWPRPPSGEHVTFSLEATEITGARDPLTCVDS